MTKKAKMWAFRLAATATCGGLMLNATGAVIPTRPEPPIWKAGVADNIESLDIDFNGDGAVDIRLVTDGGIATYFNWPTRVIERWSPVGDGARIDYQGLAAAPFGASIGSELSDFDPSRFMWWAGSTNTYDLTVQYGNHRAGVLGIFDPQIIGLPPVATGEAVGREAVFGVEFYIEGRAHYGYIHFDFRVERGAYLGAGGYIYGWAYEDEPGAPILAERLRTGPPEREFKLTFISPWRDQSGKVNLVWQAAPGTTYHVEASEDLAAWTDISGGVVADRDYMLYVTPAYAAAQRFFRLVRE